MHQMTLDPDEIQLVLLSIAMSQQHSAFLRFILAFSKSHEFSQTQTYEIILQTHLFLGFPAMIEALRLAQEIWPLTIENDVHQVQNVDEQGKEICKKVYGDKYTGLLQFTDRLHPALTRWMIEHGYGRVLSRPACHPIQREIAILPILMVTNYPNQLRAHIQGLLHLGGSSTILDDIFQLVALFIPKEQMKDLRTMKRAVPGD